MMNVTLSSAFRASLSAPAMQAEQWEGKGGHPWPWRGQPHRKHSAVLHCQCPQHGEASVHAHTGADLGQLLVRGARVARWGGDH